MNLTQLCDIKNVGVPSGTRSYLKLKKWFARGVQMGWFSIDGRSDRIQKTLIEDAG
jgi:hypothetical protein